MTTRYTLLSEIGRGGMGVVWKARDEETGSIVAIKLMREGYADDPDYVRRFEREAELAQRIDSIHVVKVLDYGLRDGVPFLALEYVEGPSLYEALTRHGPYDWTETKAILAQLAQGLADANAAGVVHRDIKPSNILMDPDGTAKLTDFGIARGLNFTRITATATIVGTPAYLAPEGPKEARSDLYSLGVIGYELLTGAVPFKGTTYQEMVIAHIREAPDLSVLPQEAQPVIGWLLAKDPAERPARASALLPVLWGAETVPEAGAALQSQSTVVTGPAAPRHDASATQIAPTVVMPSETLAIRRESPGQSYPQPGSPQLGHQAPLRSPGQPPGGPSSDDRRSSASLGRWLTAVCLVAFCIAVAFAGAFLQSNSKAPAPSTNNAAATQYPGATGQAVKSSGLVGAGTFSPTGSMAITRFSGTATLLSDGRVLIAGGGSDSAELYDPRAGTFSPTGSMKDVRWGQTATLLSDGRVLIAGGQSGGPLASAELYDPKLGTFSPTGSMGMTRRGQTATLLSDGRVLIAGGIDGNSTLAASAELYDPRAGTFGPTGSMRKGRYYQTATLLSDGRVLIAGGDDNSAELYDPKAGTFGPTGSMGEPRSSQTATLLPDGRVLIAGSAGSSAELYDPKAGTFGDTGSMGEPRLFQTATLLPDGHVLIAGGSDDGSAELYDPKAGTFGPAGSMAEPRGSHTATLLSDGRALIAGGSLHSSSGWSYLSSAELYTP